MKKGIFILLLVSFISNIHAKEKIFDKIIILNKNIPGHLQLGEKLYTISLQPYVFYMKPEQYGLIPAPVNKKYQTFKNNNTKLGSILYFEYKSEQDVQRVVPFLQGLLYGSSQTSTTIHPELIFSHKNMLIIFSFHKRNKDAVILKKIIENKNKIKLKKYAYKKTTRLKQCKFSNNTSLFFNIPQTFSINYSFNEQKQFGVLLITGKNKHDFKMMVTFGYLIGQQKKYSSDDIKNLCLKTGNKLLASAVENTLQLKKLEGTYSNGYYYQLTDKTPQPDEYKYLTQGASAIDNILMLFTVLTNDKNSNYEQQGLEIIKTAFIYLNKEIEQTPEN